MPPFKKVDIIHPKYGIVQCVEEGPCVWVKNGAHYYAHEGWREIPQKQWVDVTRECYIGEYGAIRHDGKLTQEYPYRRSMRDGHILIEKEVLS